MVIVSVIECLDVVFMVVVKVSIWLVFYFGVVVIVLICSWFVVRVLVLLKMMVFIVWVVFNDL